MSIMSTPVTEKTSAQTDQDLKQLHAMLPTLFGESGGIYEVRKGSFVISFLLNTLFITSIIFLGTMVATHPQEVKSTVVELIGGVPSIPMAPAPQESGGGGGGGDRDKLAAVKGALPKLAKEQFTPPMVVVRNDNPKLVVAPTVVVAPEIKLPTFGSMGDPLSNVVGPASNGTGSGGGIGSGSGGGVGSGRGPGVGPGWGGGYGGGAYRVGGGVSAPRGVFMPDPEYSEEARKAKYQGTVVLWVVVGPDGRTHEVRVQRSLGMGLDEKAIEAVRTWKFDPAKKDGKPVAVQINVEVNFRLY